MRSLFCAAVLLFFSAGLMAQGKLDFSQTTINFGNIEAWDNPPARFIVTNNTAEAQYILSPRYGRGISVDYPLEKLQPGTSDTIIITYYTDTEGKFEEEIEVYSSGAAEPVKLLVKGNIKSLATNALTSCPDFRNSGGNELTETWLEGLVIDKETGEPVPDASVALSYSSYWFTDKQGEFKVKLLMGLYSFHIYAVGYNELITPVGVKRFNDKLVFELEKPSAEVPVAPIPVDTPVTDPIVSLPDENPDFSNREYRPNNIVLLVDVSGSMKKNGKIDSLKSAMNNLVKLVRSVDYISLIAFSSYSREIFLDKTGADKAEMAAEVDSLIAKGTTNGVQGIERAYELCETRFIEGGNNIVLVATDGMFADASGDDGGFSGLAEEFLEKGIKLSVIGFGEDKDGVKRMEKIAEAGGGNYIQFTAGTTSGLKLVDEIKSQSRR